MSNHIEYIKHLQRVRTVLKPVNADEAALFEWLVTDALEDPGKREPSYWDLGDDGGGFVEYTDAHGHLQRTRLGRYLSRMSTIEQRYNTSMVQSFAEKFGGLLAFVSEDFKVLEGDDLVAAYRDNIEGGNGCMRKSFSVLTEWYAENGVRMLTYQDKCRALLWNSDQGDLLVDRIYPNKGNHVSAYMVWAVQNGALVRNNQSCPTGGEDPWHGFKVPFQFTPREDLVMPTVTMDPPSNGWFPYMDTFSRTHDDPEERMVLRIKAGIGDTLHVFHDTCGGPVNEAHTCQYCHKFMGDDDTGHCDECLAERVVCPECDGLFEELGYEIESSEGTLEVCHDCRYMRAATCVQCDCGVRISRNDPPEGWHSHAACGVWSCPDCVGNFKCAACGDPATEGHFYLNVQDPNGYVSGYKLRACSPNCLTQVVECMQEAVDEMAPA